MSLKNNTIKTYNLSLEKMISLGIDLNNIDIEKLIEIFNKHNIPLTSQNSYLSALQWYNKNNNKNNELTNAISTKIRLIRQTVTKEYKENRLSKKEEVKYIPWIKVEEIYNNLKIKAYSENDIRLNQDLLLLSYYVLHPPRRAIDYQNMYFDVVDISKEKNKIIWMNDASIEKYAKTKDIIDEKGKLFEEKNFRGTGKNYYMRNGGLSFFIFDDYKTASIYGRQIIEVSSKLDLILLRHIRLFGVSVGSQLLNLSYENYLKRLCSIFEVYCDRTISIDMIRHIYVSKLFDDNSTSDLEKQRISRLMGHSEETQKLYRKLVPKVEEIELLEVDGIIKKTYKKHNTEDERMSSIKESKKAWYKANKKKDIIDEI